MNIRFLLLSVTLIIMICPAVAQNSSPSRLTQDFGFTGAVNIINRSSVSVGFGKIGYIRNLHAGGSYDELLGYTFENEFVVEDEFLYAPKLGIHVNLLFFYIGISTGFYTNFRDRSFLTVNPELGIGFFLCFILWNPTITIADFGENLTQHNLTVKVLLPFSVF